MTAYELAIFDMDGTLVDSENIAALAFRDAVTRTMGVELDLETFTADVNGRPLDWVLDHIAQLCNKPVPDTYMPAFDELYDGLVAEHLLPMPGAQETLEALNGVKRCVASNSYPNEILNGLTIANLLDYFDGNLFSGTEVPSPKPAPDVFLHAANVMGVPVEKCIVVEDSAVGASGALAAGITTIGFVSEHNLANGKAFAELGVPVINRLLDFPPIVLGS